MFRKGHVAPDSKVEPHGIDCSLLSSFFRLAKQGLVQKIRYWNSRGHTNKKCAMIYDLVMGIPL